ncbi:MAG: hypothetical protein RLZZ28_1087 [Bacteroidota bacterium]
MLHFYHPANLNLLSKIDLMQIVVKATDTQQKEFLLKGIPEGIDLWFHNNETVIPEAAAYFDLCYEEEGPAFADIKEKPVFINAVIDGSHIFAANCFRINAWNGFLARDILEICMPAATGSEEDALVIAAKNILAALHWKYQPVADVPGMIAARVIAMIVNEAYFGLGDGISSRADIDTAMKLGTNYPYGPFEWAGIIGLPKIYRLLKRLAETDARYTIAPLLLMETEEKNN